MTKRSLISAATSAAILLLVVAASSYPAASQNEARGGETKALDLAQILGCWTNFKRDADGLTVGKSMCIRENGKVDGHYFDRDGDGVFGGDFGFDWNYDHGAGRLELGSALCDAALSKENTTLTISMPDSTPDRTLSACPQEPMSFSRCGPESRELKICGMK